MSTNQIELRFLVRDYYHQALEKARLSFVQKYPNVKISFEVVEEKQYAPTLHGHVENGTVPDLLELDETQLKDALNRGIVADLCPRLLADGIDVDDFYPKVLDAMRFDGKMAGLPMRPVNMVIFFNRKLFDEADIAYPKEGWRWDDFVATAKALTKEKHDGTQQYGIFFPYEMENMEPFVLASGSSLLSPDGSTARGFLDSPETVHVIEELAALHHTHRVAPAPDARNSWDDMFIRDKFAMQYKGAWSLGMLKQKGMYDQYGAVGLPNNALGTHGSYFCILGYSLAAQTPHPEEAWQFLRHLAIAESEESLDWQIGIATRKSVAQRKKQTDDHLMSAFIREFDYVHKTAASIHPAWRRLEEEIINPAVYEAIKSGNDLQIVLRSIAQRLEGRLK